MRMLFWKIVSLAGAASLLLVGACRDEGQSLTPEQQIVRALSATTWNATTVQKDNVEQAAFADFTMSFTGTLTYAASGGPDLLPFPASGSWELGTPLTTQLILGAGNQNIEVAYELSGSTLAFEFDYTGNGFPNSRTAGLNGRWRFVLSQD